MVSLIYESKKSHYHSLYPVIIVDPAVDSKLLYGVTFGNNTFVGVGQSGRIGRSTDNGSTWNISTSPITTSFRGVTFSE